MQFDQIKTDLQANDRIDWIDYIPVHYPVIVQRLISFMAIIHQSKTLFPIYYFVYTTLTFFQLVMYTTLLCFSFQLDKISDELPNYLSFILRYDYTTFSKEAQTEIIATIFSILLIIYFLILPFFFLNKPFWYVSYYHQSILIPFVFLLMHALLPMTTVHFFISLYQFYTEESLLLTLTVPSLIFALAGEYMNILFFELFPCSTRRYGAKWLPDHFSKRITFFLLFFSYHFAFLYQHIEIIRVSLLIINSLFLSYTLFQSIQKITFVYPLTCSIIWTCMIFSIIQTFCALMKILPSFSLILTIIAILFPSTFLLAKNQMAALRSTAKIILNKFYQTKNAQQTMDSHQNEDKINPNNSNLCYADLFEKMKFFLVKELNISIKLYCCIIMHSLESLSTDEILILFNIAFHIWSDKLWLYCCYIRFAITQPNSEELMEAHAKGIYQTATKSMMDMITTASFHLLIFGVYINRETSISVIHQTVHTYLNCLHLFWMDTLSGKMERLSHLVVYTTNKFMEVIAIISHLKAQGIFIDDNEDYKLFADFIDESFLKSHIENFQMFLRIFFEVQNNVATNSEAPRQNGNENNKTYSNEDKKININGKKQIMLPKDTAFTFLYKVFLFLPFIFGGCLFLIFSNEMYHHSFSLKNFWTTTLRLSQFFEIISSVFVNKTNISDNLMMTIYDNLMLDDFYLMKKEIPYLVDFSNDVEWISYTTFGENLISAHYFYHNEINNSVNIFNVNSFFQNTDILIDEITKTNYEKIINDLHTSQKNVIFVFIFIFIYILFLIFVLAAKLMKIRSNYKKFFMRIPKTAITEIVEKINNVIFVSEKPNPDLKNLPNHIKYNLQLLSYPNPPSFFTTDLSSSLYCYLYFAIIILIHIIIFCFLMTNFFDKQEKYAKCIPRVKNLLQIPQKVLAFSYFSTSSSNNNLYKFINSVKYDEIYCTNMNLTESNFNIMNYETAELIQSLMKSFKTLLRDSSDCPYCFDQRILFEPHPSFNFSFMSSLNYALAMSYEYFNSSSPYLIHNLMIGMEHLFSFHVSEKAEMFYGALIRRDMQHYYFCFLFYLICCFGIFSYTRINKMNLHIHPDFINGVLHSIPTQYRPYDRLHHSDYSMEKESTKDAEKILRLAKTMEDLNSIILLVNKKGRISHMTNFAHNLFNSKTKQLPLFSQFFEETFIYGKEEEEKSPQNSTNIPITDEIDKFDVNKINFATNIKYIMKDHFDRIYSILFYRVFYNDISFACSIDDITNKNKLIYKMNKEEQRYDLLMRQLVPMQVAAKLITNEVFPPFSTDDVFIGTFYITPLTDNQTESEYSLKLNLIHQFHNVNENDELEYDNQEFQDSETEHQKELPPENQITLENEIELENFLTHENEINGKENEINGKENDSVDFEINKILNKIIKKYPSLTFHGRSVQVFRIISGLFPGNNSVNQEQNKELNVKELVEFSLEFIAKMKKKFIVYNVIDYAGKVLVDVCKYPFPFLHCFGYNSHVSSSIAVASQPNQVNIDQNALEILNDLNIDITLNNIFYFGDKAVKTYRVQIGID
ncbi:hypothetical protein TRFO_25606 [Tritrichomonas foetus]|uniref:Uncharacterized protein n=1 Tax=Tritrichomonas foetus TaxID=1144522 RepID=A0A1J4K4M0_9EUKA|nr:hypothetical protein TRFO_25606 [Tritrichomonas foetus]|eukprot:OHT06335.1 hypothetical protein TRFO_25606 [Tritrichomonas foetus]